MINSSLTATQSEPPAPSAFRGQSSGHQAQAEATPETTHQQAEEVMDSKERDACVSYSVPQCVLLLPGEGPRVPCVPCRAERAPGSCRKPQELPLGLGSSASWQDFYP